MGIFSFYIDQGFRVVLVAEERELEKKFDRYSETKERIIGHTVKLEPMTLEAFDSFVENIEEPSRKYLKEKKQFLLDVFSTSGCASLRILKRMISDLGRLHQSLKPRHLRHEQAMQELFGMFVAFGVEIRMDRLRPNHLKNRANARMLFELKKHTAENEYVEAPAFIAASDRYSNINLESQIVGDDVLEEIFGHGGFSAERISASLDHSPYFVKPEEMPPWKVVTSFDKLDDKTLNDALKRMDAQFVDRKVTESGEMLHMFSLRLMMVEEGISGADLDVTRNECITYIDDLLAKGRLPPRELEQNWYDRFNTDSGGSEYWVYPSYRDHFKAIKEHLIEARGKALVEAYPRLASGLIEKMADGAEFFRQVCGDGPYALIPVLSGIEPSRFVAAWLATPRTNWGWIRDALQERFDSLRIQHELADERDWALEVVDLMEQRRKKLTGFEAFRVSRIIPKLQFRE